MWNALNTPLQAHNFKQLTSSSLRRFDDTVAERGLLAARYAATAAEQLAALKQAEAATALINANAVPPE
jgi:hypothetical protein